MSSWYSPVSQAIRQELSMTIASKAARGNISLVEELMGYTMAGTQVERTYGPLVSTEVIPRRIAAPEILTGLVRNSKV